MFSSYWYHFYGYFYLIISAVSLPLHLLVGVAVFQMPSFRKRIVLPMVFSLSVCDSLQLFIHAISGYFVVVDGNVELTINIIVGMTMEGLWCITLFQHVAIAFNRMFIFCKKGISGESKLTFLDWIPIYISWLGGIFYALCYVYEGRNTHFDKELLSWSGTLQWKTFNRVLLYTKFSLLIAGLLACFVVVFVMIIKRRDHGNDQRLFKPIEIQLFAQTSTVFLIAIIYTFLWYFIDQTPDNLHVLALVNLDQIIICALSPYLNLIMSSEIRKSVYQIVTCKRRTNSSELFTKKVLSNIARIQRRCLKIPKFSAIRCFNTQMITDENLTIEPTTSTQDAYSQDENKSSSVFRDTFKHYRKRATDVDMSKVLDLRVSNEFIGLKCVPVHSNIDVSNIPGIRPISDWTLSTLENRPGLYVLNNIITKKGQLEWMQNCLLKYAEPPNKTNFHVDGSYYGDNVFMERGEKLRWVTMGNDYDWTAKTYADKPREKMPQEMIDIGLAVTKILQLEELHVDAAILNFYPEKANLSPHVDKAERSITRPLVSVSLGQDAIYLTGGKSLEDPIDALLLQSGDCLVMHGEQRLVYHAVPRILATTKYTDEEKKIHPKVLNYANKCRVNITLRQVD